MQEARRSKPVKTIKKRVAAIRKTILAVLGHDLTTESSVVHVYLKAVYVR